METLKPSKAVIFTKFAEMAKVLMRELAEYGPLLIAGEVSSEDRQKAVDLFNSDRSRKLIISTDAGAYGLNLQSADHVFMYDLPWSVAKLLQREDRAHRMGQTRPVNVINLVARGTIDEYVAKVLKRKGRQAVEVLEDESRLEEAGLTAEEIREILRI